MNQQIISISDMTFAYSPDQLPVFAQFSWSVVAGERWAVVGRSGCGKSTLLNLLAGLNQPDSGSLLVDGRPVTRPQATTGLILQDHGLLPWATVWKNAALGLRLGHFYRNKQGPQGQTRPYPPARPLEEVDGWLQRLGIDGVRDKYPSQISGGQQQRVAIARTLALQPRLLLMDEPFSALDAHTREELEELILTLVQELQMTMVVVTHDVAEAIFLGQKVLFLDGPPNPQVTVLEGRSQASTGYRQSDEFIARTRSLRQLLESTP